MNNKKQLQSIASVEDKRHKSDQKDEKSTERREQKPPQEEEGLEEGIDEIGIQADDEDND
jgi:hypothetical protein